MHVLVRAYEADSSKSGVAAVIAAFSTPGVENAKNLARGLDTIVLIDIIDPL